MDAAERHMLRCRKCTRDMNTQYSPSTVVLPWLDKRLTNKVSCVHQQNGNGTMNKEELLSLPKKNGDVFGSPISGHSHTACAVCGICQGSDSTTAELCVLGGESRFTITTLRRQQRRDGPAEQETNNNNNKLSGSGAGFLIAVKDWLVPSGIPKRPLRKLEAGGGYQVIKRNLLNRRAEPVYNNEFHLTPPPPVKEEEEEESVAPAVVVAGLKSEKEDAAVVTVAAGEEPLYAVVNKAAKVKYKNAVAGGAKYSFLTDTLSRKQTKLIGDATGESGIEGGGTTLFKDRS